MKQREKNYDYLRAISCIAIILLHVSSSYWSAVNKESTDFIIMTIYNGLTRFAVPVFMMLSGAFMLDPDKEITINQSFKRFEKTLLVFYIWSAFYAFQGIAVKAVTGKEITNELWKQSLERFIWGHYHMWFVFLILGFYLLVPIARKVAENKTLMEYFLILWAVTRYIIPSVAGIGKMSLLSVWINKLDLNMLVGYLGYFILGYYIRKYGWPRRIRMILYAGAGVGLIYSIVETIRQSRIQGICVESFFSPGYWSVLLLSVAVFTFFTYLKTTGSRNVFPEKVAGYSFIIYMIHPFFLEKLNLVGVTTISFHCLFSIPILTIGIFLCSFMIAAITKRIPYINKLLI